MRAFAASNGQWTPALLDMFLSAPRDTVPGTTMGYDGLDNAQHRAALLSYLATLN